MSAFLTRLFMAVVLFAAVLPSALAEPKAKPAPKCPKNKFFFPQRNICLLWGGPAKYSKPPKGKTCPSYGWAWSGALSSCVPKYPPKYYPQCPKGYEWCPPEWACVPKKTSPKPPAPKPSNKAGTPPKGKGKREELVLPKKCPVGLEACPIPTANGVSSDFECLDTHSELESCGGCASTGEGQDCTAIPGAWNVACNRGKCEVSSCAPGFTLSKATGSCVAN